MPKLTKEEAEYGPSKGGERCGECRWYETQRPSTCEIVDGAIGVNMVSKFFHDASHRRGSRLSREQDRQRKEVARMRAKKEQGDAL